MKTPPERDYEVGYGKPPVATRFKPGQCGNPKGRPKKALNIKTILAALTEQKVTVVLGGKKVRMRSLEAMLQNNYQKALKADPRAFERFLKLLADYGVAMPKPEAEIEPLDENEDEILSAFLRKQRQDDGEGEAGAAA